jgi:uncharacterized protein YdeI (YjbR/CyaY-like superfamily)
MDGIEDGADVDICRPRTSSGMNPLLCKTIEEWRTWLRQNHRKVDEIWLVFYKKGAGEQSFDYDSALDEALCFGWIDSLIKRIDDTKYARKFTPRNQISKWSESNKRRVERLIKDGRMTEAGLAVVKAAKANGCWDKLDRPPTVTEVPAELQAALQKNKKAREHFNELAPSHQKQYIMWIAMAKRQETREKRIREAIALLEKGQKLGLK